MDSNELSDSDLKSLVLKFPQKVELLELKAQDQDEQIVNLQNEVTHLEKRISLQERYWSQDCIIFHNFPVNVLSPDLDVDMCRLMNYYFYYNESSADFKACHPLKPSKTFQ